jgi:hypothetical protein
VTPGIQNLIREAKSFRIDSEIQTGKRYGMQLLDDNLWMHFTAGRIAAEEAIDKAKNPGYMVDRMQKNGHMVDVDDDALMAEAEDEAGGDGAAGSGAKNKPTPPGGAGGAAGADAEKAAQAAANRARMQAMNQKR